METLSMEDEYDAYVKRAIHRHLYKHFWSRIDPGRALLYLCAMIVAGFLLASFIPALIFLERSYHYPPWLPTTVKIVLGCSPISLALLFEGLSYRFYRKQAKDPHVMFSVIQTLTNEDIRAAPCMGAIASVAINGTCRVHIATSNIEMMEVARRNKLSYIHSKLFPPSS